MGSEVFPIVFWWLRRPVAFLLSVDWILGSISNVAPAFWATNLIASTVDLNSISFAEKSDFIDFWVNTQANWSTATLVLAFMSIVLAIATWLITDRVRATR